MDRISESFHPKYRPDIDGLRSVAVISVLIFHAFPEWLPGGFVGVDIFFVISGYLISTIIFKNLEKNNFSFLDFYMRRVRRIFPSLILVLLACYTFGWISLFADEYAQLGKHIAASAASVQNIILWQESGYFDNASDSKPLLHLWSLGIEEQFYILWPFFLWLFSKNNIKKHYLLIFVFFASFLFSIYIIYIDVSEAFYSPLTRCWELASGSFLAYIHLYHFEKINLLKNKVIQFFSADESLLNHILSFLGLILIIIAIFTLSENSLFPGFWALLPVAGSFILIFAGQNAWINKIILSNRIAVYTGLISYPLYLWHWPLFSFLHILKGQTLSLELRFYLLILSFILASLSYHFVEKYLRSTVYGRLKAGGLTFFMLILFFAGMNIYYKDGKSNRNIVKFSDLYAMVLGFEGYNRGYANHGCDMKNKADEYRLPDCNKDSREKAVYALIGDSKANSLNGALFRESLPGKRWIYLGGTNSTVLLSTVPVISSHHIYEKSAHYTNLASDAVINNPSIKTVVLVTATRQLFNLKKMNSLEELPSSPYYQAAFEGLNEMILKLKNGGKKIVFVVDNPTLPDPKYCIERRTSIKFINQILNLFNNETICVITLDRQRELSKQYLDLLAALQKKHDKSYFRVYDPTPILCEMDNGTCSAYKNGKLMYAYTDHISDYAAGLIARDLHSFLDEFN
ncbi:MAG: acyltransferase [Spirochaetia bacterium]|nr:acyltransferase [Spirochaetia bacterium]